VVPVRVTTTVTTHMVVSRVERVGIGGEKGTEKDVPNNLKPKQAWGGLGLEWGQKKKGKKSQH